MAMKLFGIGAFQKAEDVLRRILCETKRDRADRGWKRAGGGGVVSIARSDKKYL